MAMNHSEGMNLARERGGCTEIAKHGEHNGSLVCVCTPS